MEDREVIECLGAEDGSFLWSYSYDTDYQDKFNYLNGPRAAPAISEGRVYTLGVQGMLHCLDLCYGPCFLEARSRAGI